jgi:hypothetical protein
MCTLMMFIMMLIIVFVMVFIIMFIMMSIIMLVQHTVLTFRRAILLFIQLHKKMSGEFKKKSCVFPVPEEVQLLMTKPTETITFNFFDPTDILVRLLVFSPVAAREENMAFFPENSLELHDFCHGDRMKRIHNSLPKGAAALNAVLFFDEINRDEKGFATGDGALIVGGFFRQRVRESTHAKASLGTFPNVQFPQVYRVGPTRNS